ncbi:RNA polymerase sigma factor [Mariniblastus fucicola]|uniref:RNA polymerase sigma factor RpoE n=1 Tax=Mariniblastus fucicola TaxID=980251 RepID=A0A5B9P6M9_9BACT|nr:sigma-70 family RNA polymerase sigma factor [Mariniblastus fucicola]QEG21918.1 RNA polymerase sigma factor RpoE [Mariniblastus fucicola]
MDSTSESLLLRLRSGSDQRAWSTFVELYTPLIFYWARKTGLQTNDAADLVQDVLTLTFQKLPAFKYDAGKSFRGWLRTVTLNRYREKLRKKSIGATPATQSVLASIAQPGDAESTWDLNYQQALVSRAKELLRHEFQASTWQALQQYVFEGQPAAIAAKENGLSVWTVYAAKSRLMSRLRETLDGLL